MHVFLEDSQELNDPMYIHIHMQSYFVQIPREFKIIHVLSTRWTKTTMHFFTLTHSPVHASIKSLRQFETVSLKSLEIKRVRHSPCAHICLQFYWHSWYKRIRWNSSTEFTRIREKKNECIFPWQIYFYRLISPSAYTDPEKKLPQSTCLDIFIDSSCVNIARASYHRRKFSWRRLKSYQWKIFFADQKIIRSKMMDKKIKMNVNLFERLHRLLPPIKFLSALA